MGTAANMAGTAGLGALSAGANFNPYQAQNQFSAPQSYQAGQFSANQVQGGNYNAPSMGTAQTAFNPQLQNYQMGPAERVGTNTFGTQSAQDYMNPYMQNVVDIQKREAQRSADIAGTQRGAQAVKSGAFGGARQAIMDAEAQRNLSQQMGDIQAQGSQAAYDRAAQMFTSDQARQLAAQQANQQAGITTGGQNLSANLATQQLGTQTGLQGALANLSAAQQANVQNQASQLQTQGLNAQQAMQAALANQQYGLETQKLGEQSRQFGAGQGMTAAQLQAQYGQSAEALAEQSKQFGSNLGMQGFQTALTGAGQLANIGQQTFGQEMDVNKLQNQYGAQQQAFNQQGMDTQYQDFLNQQRYPYQQLEFMNSMLRGTPMGTVQSMYQPAPSALSQLAGLGTAAYGVSRMAGGGQVQGYASGGIAGLNPMELDAATDSMSDTQMQGVMGLASVTDLAKLQIAQKLAQNTQIRQAAQQAQAAQQQQPQGSIAEEALAELGVGGLDVPDEMFSGAEGGIVAFANTGSVPGASDVRPTGRYQNPVYDGTPSSSIETFKKAMESNKLTDEERAEARAKVQGPGGIAAAIKWLSTINERKDALDTERTNRIKAEQREGVASDARSRFAKMDERLAIPGSAPLPGQLPGNDPNESPYNGEGAPVAPAWGAGDQATPTTPVASGIATLPSGMNKTMEQLIAMRQRSPEEQAALTKYEGEQKAILQRDLKREEDYAKQVKLDREELGERGVEREKYIKGEEAKLSGAEEKSVNMALIEAGLAIMSGTSANPFENLGRGVVGVKAYKEDMAKLQTRKDKLQDAMFDLEESRYGDKKLSKAEDRENQKKVSDAQSSMDKALSEIGRNNNVVFPEAVRKEAIAAFMAQETARYGAEANMAVAQFKASAERETAKITANKPPELIILAKELYEDARARGEPMTITQAMEKAAEVKGTSAYNVAALKGDNDKQVALTKSLAAIDESFNLLIAVAKDGPEKQALINERDNRKQAAIRDSGVSGGGGAGPRPAGAVKLKSQQ
jgi:hypothetical protein